MRPNADNFGCEFLGLNFLEGSETLQTLGRNICRKMCPKNVPEEFAEKHVGNVPNLLEQSKHSHGPNPLCRTLG